MDFSRQSEIFDPTKFGKTPVHIIGAGATGSWVAMLLGKMGVQNITVYDFDVIEEHNIANQAYRDSFVKTTGSLPDGSPLLGAETDIGRLKVDALSDIILDFSSTTITPVEQKVGLDSGHRFAGIVFVLTDTMSSRKAIFDYHLKMNAAVQLVIETRMGLEHGRIYAINPCNIKHVRAYDKTLYTDEETPVSACGVSQSIVATAVSIASHAVWKLIKFHNNMDMAQELIVDLQNNNILTRNFE